LRRHQAPSPPKPHSGGVASGADPERAKETLISTTTLTLQPQRKSSPISINIARNCLVAAKLYALDLCDILGSYVPGSKVKLDEVSKILGLPGKPEGIDGSRVEEMVLAGRIEEVAWYC
jgi:hypothetical protein